MSHRFAVVQPLPGIGDMIWHLPHIRALAAHFGTPLTLIAKPRSAADQLFAADDSVDDVLWLDRNPDRRRGAHDGAAGFARLVSALRKRDFRAVVILHHSRTLAMACMAAGIPERFGYGARLQRPFLNRTPHLSEPAIRLHPFEQASTWLEAAGIPLGDPEPRLAVAPAVRERIRAQVGERPFAVLGIGSSEPYKQWGAARFGELAGRLARAGWPRLIAIGGAGERTLAGEIATLAAQGGADLSVALGWPLGDVAALCAEAAFYVGNDTGVMNLTAAVGIPTFGLFGAVPPFAHASRIVAILPPDGVPSKSAGMERITPEAVLARIAGSPAIRSSLTPDAPPSAEAEG